MGERKFLEAQGLSHTHNCWEVKCERGKQVTAAVHQRVSVTPQVDQTKTWWGRGCLGCRLLGAETRAAPGPPAPSTGLLRAEDGESQGRSLMDRGLSGAHAGQGVSVADGAGARSGDGCPRAEGSCFERALGRSVLRPVFREGPLGPETADDGTTRLMEMKVALTGARAARPATLRHTVYMGPVLDVPSVP